MREEFKGVACEKCSVKDTQENPLTSFNPTGISEPLAICGDCSNEIAGVIHDDVTKAASVAAWALSRDKEKQAIAQN